MNYYADVGGELLAAEFYAELRSFFLKALEAPQSYAARTHDPRRISLKRFPYHFLFRIAGEQVRVLVVRHHGRRPSLGTSRR